MLKTFPRIFFFFLKICYSSATKVEVEIPLNEFIYLHDQLDWKINKFYKQ